MKKYNFTFQESETTNVVIDATNVAPTDYVGSIRVSKVKIPSTSLPVAIAHVTSHGFTWEEKLAYDAGGWNALSDICYICLITKGTLTPTNGYQIQYHSDSKIRIDSRTSHSVIEYSPDSIQSIRIVFHCFWERPKWVKGDDDLYYMVNEDKPIYAWEGNAMGLQRKDWAWGPDSPYVAQNNVYNKCEFIVRGQTTKNRIPNGSFISSPAVLVNQRIAEMNGFWNLPEQMRFKMAADERWSLLAWAIPFINEQNFIAPECKITLNPRTSALITLSAIPSEESNIPYESRFEVNGYRRTNEIFPVSHIAIQCLDLNFEGESMVCNSKDLMGVINPSDMYFLKTFLMGFGGEITDFIYVNDLKTEVEIPVESRYVTALKFAFFWIDHDHFVHPLQALANTTVELQIIYEPDEETTPPEKKMRLLT